MYTMKTLLIITFVISILANHIIYILTSTVAMQKDMVNGTEYVNFEFIEANDTMDHKYIYETNDTSESNIDKKKMNDTMQNKVNVSNSRFPIEGDHTWNIIIYIGTALFVAIVLIGICGFCRRYSEHIRLMRRWLRGRRVAPELDFQREVEQTTRIQRRRRNVQVDEEIDFEGQWIQQQVYVQPPTETAQYYTIIRAENNE